MKIRNGFVSNSSSSSFIINYPNRTLGLNEIGDYFGGFNDDIPEEAKGVFSYLLWKNQPNYKENPESIFFETSKERILGVCALEGKYTTDRPAYCDTYYTCEDCVDNKCPYFSYRTEKDVLNSILDNYYDTSERKKIIEKFDTVNGKVRTITVEDCGDCDNGLSFDEAFTINKYSGNFFKKHDKIVEEER